MRLKVLRTLNEVTKFKRKKIKECFRFIIQVEKVFEEKEKKI